MNKNKKTFYVIYMIILFLTIITFYLPIQALATPNSSQKNHTTKIKKSSKKDKNCHYYKRYNRNKKHNEYVLVCPPDKNFEERLEDFMKTLTPSEKSAMEKKLAAQQEVVKTKQGVSFYEPTYVLPFYYTGRPYESVYEGNTPNNQSIMNEELKAQLSFQVPVWRHMFGSKAALNISYTQLSYWQVYAQSQFFRETDYEPQLFVSDNFLPNWLGSIGINHQSNGQGGNLERSWNRAFLDIAFSGTHWLIDIKPWVLIFKQESSDLHNPDIAHYLGYERIVFAVKFNRQEISLMARNTFESSFKRGALQLDYNFPIHGILHGDIQFFSGYGQSLIEYNHYTNSAGIGISISNWL